MSEITVDAEKMIKALDKVDKANAELRAILAPGVFKEIPRSQQAQPPARAPSNDEIMSLHLDLSQVPFKIKGGSPARDTDGFAFTFLKNRDGEPWQSSAELASALEQYGKVRVGKFVYQLSKDKVFIQRVIPKE